MAEGRFGGRDAGGGAAQVGRVTNHPDLIVGLVDAVRGRDEPVGADAHGAAMPAGDQAGLVGAAGFQLHDAGEGGERRGEGVDRLDPGDRLLEFGGAGDGGDRRRGGGAGRLAADGGVVERESRPERQGAKARHASGIGEGGVPGFRDRCIAVDRRRFALSGRLGDRFRRSGAGLCRDHVRHFGSGLFRRDVVDARQPDLVAGSEQGGETGGCQQMDALHVRGFPSESRLH